MKKRQMRAMLTGILCMALLLMAGCGGRSKEALDNELAYRQLGLNEIKEGSYEEAVEAFQKALDQSLAVIEELEIDICYYKAAAQYKSGDAKGAIETYTALINYDEKNSDALYLRGTQYLLGGQNKEALADYEDALAIDKDNGRLYNKIGEHLTAAGLNEEAGNILNRALKIKEEDAADYREKGYTYYLLGQYDSARPYLDRAMDEKDTEAVFYLAKLCEAQGDNEQAAQFYESYVESNGNDTETLNALGLARMEEGNYEQALAFFQQALENEGSGNRQELRRNEIVALEYLNQFSQAKGKMEEYLVDYPEDEEAVREYEFLRSR